MFSVTQENAAQSLFTVTLNVKNPDGRKSVLLVLFFGDCKKSTFTKYHLGGDSVAIVMLDEKYLGSYCLGLKFEGKFEKFHYLYNLRKDLSDADIKNFVNLIQPAFTKKIVDYKICLYEDAMLGRNK